MAESLSTGWHIQPKDVIMVDDLRTITASRAWELKEVRTLESGEMMVIDNLYENAARVVLNLGGLLLIGANVLRPGDTKRSRYLDLNEAVARINTGLRDIQIKNKTRALEYRRKLRKQAKQRAAKAKPKKKSAAQKYADKNFSVIGAKKRSK